jgi:hypothetical protein
MRTVVSNFRAKLERESFKRIPKKSKYTTFTTLGDICKEWKDKELDFIVLVNSTHREGKTSLVKYLHTRFSHGHNNDSKEV